MNEKEVIEMFWREYSAFAINDFNKNGYHYDKKPLESAVLRTVCQCLGSASMKEEVPK